MRAVELSDDEMDALEEDEAVGYSDWKGAIQDVLETIDRQLAPFGLEVVQIETGGDWYNWRIDRRIPPQEEDTGKW